MTAEQVKALFEEQRKRIAALLASVLEVKCACPNPGVHGHSIRCPEVLAQLARLRTAIASKPWGDA